MFSCPKISFAPGNKPEITHGVVIRSGVNTLFKRRIDMVERINYISLNNVRMFMLFCVTFEQISQL